MALLTPLGSLPYPQPADAANIPVHIQSLAEAVDGRTVLRFADGAARDAKVTAPVAGMLCWLSTPKQYWYYTGSVWTQLAPAPVHKANPTVGTTTATAFVETLTPSTGDPTAAAFTAPASGSVLVSVGARINSSTTGTCFMSANVKAGSGSTVVLAAGDGRSAISTGTGQVSASTQYLVSGLTPNSAYTATAAYKCTAGTATFAFRFLTVTPVN
ncbi:hypothetical protein ACFWCA_26100 [Streptomyces phaeochromogenes]|uniref:hypothetical protein n=1 Tax=Streptomyces phaeochromogenes TaxID=1923 RepID=UPI003677F2FA